MLNALDNFYLNLLEPNKGCFLALRDLILGLDSGITPEWKYSLPFFYYRGKMFCYLWKDKKDNHPYIGIVEGWRIDHKLLEQGDRKRMKVLKVNPNSDLPIEEIQTVLNTLLDFYRNGIIKTKF